jgi:hypothetical protein
MAMTASKLRADIYRILDRVIETGEPVEIERRGQRLKIVPEKPRSKLARLKKRPGHIVGDPEDLVHMDWSVYWRP